MTDFGGMVSFLAGLRGGGRRARRARTKVWTLAESLGGVESLIEHPAPDDARVDGGLAVRGAAEPDPPLGRASSRPTT